MNKLIHKKWLSIPVTVLLVSALTAGAVLAVPIISAGQIITQTIVAPEDYGTITVENITLDNVVVGGAFAQETVDAITVNVGPDGIDKYLHLKFTSGTPQYDVFIVLLTSDNNPMGHLQFSILRSNYAPDIVDASIQLTKQGTYVFTEWVSGAAGDTPGTLSVALSITLEDTP